MCGKMKQYDLTCKMCVKHLCGPAVVTNVVYKVTNGNKLTRSSFSKTHDSRLHTVRSVVLLIIS
jgi:hypothetical protein